MSDNKFAAALQPRSSQSDHRTAAVSRQGRKHVGAYVDPAVARRLRVIAAAEDTSVQQLIEEAIAALFQSRSTASVPEPADS